MKLSPGDPLPDATLADADGNPVRLRDLRGNGWLILYFYPKDETAICTRQACLFRDHYQAFADRGATVAGISSDRPASHRQFAARLQLPFPLLSDEGGKLRKSWGVPKMFGLLQGRVTYVVDPHGVIQLIFNDAFHADRHIEKALSYIGPLPGLNPGSSS